MAVERTENIGWPCKKKTSHRAFVSLTHSQKQNSYLQSHPYLYNSFPNLSLSIYIYISISLPRHITFHLQQLLWWWCRFPKGCFHYCTGLKELKMFQVDHTMDGAILVMTNSSCGWRMTNSRFGGNLQLEARVNSRVMSMWHHLQVVNPSWTSRTTLGKIAACAPSYKSKNLRNLNRYPRMMGFIFYVHFSFIWLFWIYLCSFSGRQAKSTNPKPAHWFFTTKNFPPTSKRKRAAEKGGK